MDLIKITINIEIFIIFKNIKLKRFGKDLHELPRSILKINNKKSNKHIFPNHPNKLS